MNIKALTEVFQNRWKVFVLSLATQLIVVTLLHFGVKAPDFLQFLSVEQAETNSSLLLSPASSQESILEMIRPKLEQRINQFELKKESSLVVPVFASATSETGSVEYNEASSYIVVDLNTGKVLGSKNGDSKLSIASLTKIMTAVVALDLASSAEQFPVSVTAAAIQPTKIGVVVGQIMSLDELLNAALLTSANDAVEVIKEGIDQKYQAEIFVAAMNEKAKILGLTKTRFTNPQGFDDPSHYSSTQDLAVLSAYALDNYPQIAEIVKKDYQYLSASSNHKQFDLYNWNGLIGVYPGAAGIKIGNTGKAGYTSAVVAEREGRRVLVVVLGAPGVLERDLWSAQLLDNGFAHLGLQTVGLTEVQFREKYGTWRYWD